MNSDKTDYHGVHSAHGERALSHADWLDHPGDERGKCRELMLLAVPAAFAVVKLRLF
jgi:hypothetical protein